MAARVRIPILALVLAAGCVGEESPSGLIGPGRALAPAACVAPPSDLVAWWPGDDHANDIRGHSHGTLVGNTNYAAGQVGQAFHFDGANDEINFGNPANLQQTTAITADAWINPDTYTGNYQTIVSKWQQGTNNSWGLFVVNNDDLFAILQNSGGAFIQAGGGSIPLDAWTHVAMTYSTTDGMRLYVNGVEVATAAANGSIRVSTAEVHIGDDTDDTVQREFDGLIDEVEIFDRALSAAEIAAIHAAGADGKCKSSCFGVTVTTTGTPDGMGGLNLTAGDDVWEGTDGAETVFGLGGDDRMCALDGADVLSGGAGNDLLDAGAGDDGVMGGADADVLHGGPGVDTMDGEDGTDTLYGDADADTLSGGTGSDLIVGDDGDDVIDGGADADQLYGFAGADSIRGGGGNDRLNGGSDGDLLLGDEGQDLIQGQLGDDRLDGGSENDKLVGGPGADHHAGGPEVDQARKFSCAENDTWDGTVERGVPGCAVLAM